MWYLHGILKVNSGGMAARSGLRVGKTRNWVVRSFIFNSRRMGIFTATTPEPSGYCAHRLPNAARFVRIVRDESGFPPIDVASALALTRDCSSTLSLGTTCICHFLVLYSLKPSLSCSNTSHYSVQNKNVVRNPLKEFRSSSPRTNSPFRIHATRS